MRLERFGLPVDPELGPTPEPGAWSKVVSDLVDGALENLAAPGASDPPQFYNPTAAGAAPAADETPRQILWSAFPLALELELGTALALEQADDAMTFYGLGQTAAGVPHFVVYRKQTEYCEWTVERDHGSSGPIRRVIFSTEPAEYWSAVAATDLDAVLRYYRTATGDPGVRREDITFERDVFRAGSLLYAAGAYNPWNLHNVRKGFVHMSSPGNFLGAAINQCANATVGRGAPGHELRDPVRFLGALDPLLGGAGINNSADTAIVGVTGALARNGARIAMADPVALVLGGLDTRGWRLPSGAPAERYWQVTRRGPAGAVRAEYAVPASEGFAVSDIRIRGVPIQYGGQIARCLTIGLGISAMGLGTFRHTARAAAGRAVRRAAAPDALVTVAAAAPADPRYEAVYPPAPARLVEPILEADDIQGNALVGFNKKHQWVVGFDIVDGARARRWLGEQAGRLATTSALAAHRAHHRAHRAGTAAAPEPAVFWNLAFSQAGLRRLRPDDTGELDSVAFREGLAARGLLDVDAEPHILAIVAADTPSGIADVLAPPAALAGFAGSVGLRLAYRREGRRSGDREHFGFRDNLSQPAVRGHLPSPGHPWLTPRSPGDGDGEGGDPHGPESAGGQTLVWPGEFVLGYPRQSLRHPRSPATARPFAPAWARNGSFLVYLRLAQYVDAFQEHIDAEAARTGLAPDLVAARLMGRWRSGSPVVEHPGHDGARAHNDFGFERDPTGSRCPFSAHIRKVNPRDDTTESGAVAATLRRRILRRGITYGPPHEGKGDKRSRGLLFLCYQASIEDQFEFLLGSWLQDGLRPSAPGGVDPLIGTKRFVEPLEGGYFFAPSLAGVQHLAR